MNVEHAFTFASRSGVAGSSFPESRPRASSCTSVKQITATGGAQEFGRNRARNDYPLLALWEMGVRLCKVPAVDVLGGRYRP